MRISFHGAAGEVTGSCYLVQTRTARILVDCGMFQGLGATDAKNAALGPVDPRRLDAVILTHAHLDHCGRLPLLGRLGFRGSIHCTAATADLAEVILLDSAHLQEADAERETRHRGRRGQPAVEPLYVRKDVEALAPRFHKIDYDRAYDVADGATVRLVDAGHMLGSASIEMTIREAGVERRIVFSGDLGVKGTPILRDPTPLEHADLVVMESTYGNRNHRPLSETLKEFLTILRDASRDRERVLIPAFAVGRSQQLIYHIAEFIRAGQLPPIPIYLDSPMAIEATWLYEQHENLFDAEAAMLAREDKMLSDVGSLRFTRTAEESRQLNNLRDAAVIIAASGMCEGGRIVHHLKHNLWRRYVHVVFVGYQAEGTLGSRLVRGAKEVNIRGERVVVGADIHTLGGFSGHAGQTELLDWLGHLASDRPRVVLTHGEEPQRQALAAKVAERFGLDAARPQLGESIELA